MKTPLTLLFLLLFFIAGVQAQEKRIALIIGNATYTQGALRNPVNDANLMETTLKGLGFEVIKTTNATKLRMEQVVRQFSEKLGNYNVALFFYAGHGMQANGVNYLIPVDAKLAKESDLKFEAIPVNFVVEEFENYPNNTNIVILDACRDNPLTSWARSGSRGFKAIQPKGETIIAFATLEGSTASDGEGYNGLFTSKLVQQMKTPQLIESVFKNTRIEVRNASAGKQIPQEWSTLTSNFAFVKNAPPPKGSEPTVGGFVSGKAVYEYGDIVIDTEIGGKLYLNDKYMGEVRANTTENKVQQQLTGNYTLKIVGSNETHTEQVTVYKDRQAKVDVKSKKQKSNTSSTSGSTFTDSRDDKTYKTVKIGNQVWMAENLAYKPSSGNYWAYDNNQSNVAKYGYLYDWETAMKSCPNGWHLPSDPEWTQLENTVGTDSRKKLKATGGWNNHSNGTDEFGFSALPGGYRDNEGYFSQVGSIGYWWGSTQNYRDNEWYRTLSKYGSVYPYNFNKSFGFSVRCLRD